VLLGAVRDESRPGAGQPERRPGRGSREPGLRVHRRPHGAARRTPVEHRQVTHTHTHIDDLGGKVTCSCFVIVIASPHTNELNKALACLWVSGALL